MKNVNHETEALVSVIVPTHGRTWELLRALESVLGQTYPNYEVIVISDNSTDQETGEEVVKTIRSLCAPIRLIENQQSCGGAGSRNRGIEAARGDLIAFLDDDDEWLPEKLARQVPFLISSHERVACIDTGFFRVDDSSGTREVVLPHRMPRDAFSWLLLKENGRAPKLSSLLCRKDSLLAIGCFDESLPSRQDLDLYLRLALYYEFLSIDEKLVINHIHEGPRITKNWKSKAAGYGILYKKYYQDISKNHRNHGKYLARYGTMQLRAGDCVAGKKTLLRALRYDPLNVRAWKGLFSLRSFLNRLV